MVICINTIQEMAKLLGAPIHVEYSNSQYKILIDNHIYYRNPMELNTLVAEILLFKRGDIIWG